MGSSWGKRVRRAAIPFRPALEALEDRTVPAQFTAADVPTLIADINIANDNGQSNTINLSAGTYDLTTIDNDWYGPNGLPAITSNLTINGNGAVIQRDSAAPDFRLFYVSGGLDGELPLGSLTLTNVTLQNGIAEGGSSDGGGGGLGAGGAIFNQGTLNLNGVTLTNNRAIGGSGSDSSENEGGGGMGQNAQVDDGGGFGSLFSGGSGGFSADGQPNGSGGGGGGFVTGANGSTSAGAGQGGFGGGNGDGGDGGSGFDSPPPTQLGGRGGSFGEGGIAYQSYGGGGGGVGGGGGAGGLIVGGPDDGQGGAGGAGGFGGGGGGSPITGGAGGFGGGGGHGLSVGAAGGFGGGQGGTSSTGPSGGGGAGMGGALFSMGASTVIGSGVVTITNSTFTANSAIGGSTSGAAQGGSGYGGAIFNLDGDLTLSNDTLDANSVAAGTGGTNGVAAAGAVFNLADHIVIQNGSAASATLTASNSIFAQTNGGIRPTTGVDGPQTANIPNEDPLRAISGLDLVNEAVAAGNTATVTGSTNLVMASLLNVGAGTTSVSPGFIATTANPNLGPLGDNGGPTETMADAPGSSAYGAGNASVSGLPATDQRGLSRLSSQGLDLGAFEFQTVAPPPPSPSPPPPPGRGDVALLFLAEDVFAFTVDSVLVRVSSNPALTQLADRLMVALNDLAHLFNPALGTGLAGLQSAIKANPYYGTPPGQVAIDTGLDRAAIFFATHDLN